MSEAIEDLCNRTAELGKLANAVWLAEIEPRLSACKSKGDVMRLMADVSRSCADKHGQIREMPGDWSVQFILAIDRLRQLAKGSKEEPAAFNPDTDCQKNHRKCEAPELCIRSDGCMGA
jgi:hypothetical protein